MPPPLSSTSGPGLAHYKAPRIVLERSTIGRAPNGKVDYKGLTAWARDQVAAG